MEEKTIAELLALREQLEREIRIWDRMTCKDLQYLAPPHARPGALEHKLRLVNEELRKRG